MSYMTPRTSGVFNFNKYPKREEPQRSRIKIRGLGDVLAIMFKFLGIKKVVTVATKGDCGCGKRQERLNKRFPLGHDR